MSTLRTVALGLLTAGLFDSRRASLHPGWPPNRGPGRRQPGPAHQRFLRRPELQPRRLGEAATRRRAGRDQDQHRQTRPAAAGSATGAATSRRRSTAYVGAADAADKLPILVAYNIPGRDCGGHSGGRCRQRRPRTGTWIATFADGHRQPAGRRGHRAGRAGADSTACRRAERHVRDRPAEVRRRAVRDQGARTPGPTWTAATPAGSTPRRWRSGCGWPASATSAASR